MVVHPGDSQTSGGSTTVNNQNNELNLKDMHKFFARMSTEKEQKYYLHEVL
jgi:hypothetical protein